MGENLLKVYGEKVKKEWKLAFWWAFSLCLLIHMYKFTNTLINHDSLYNVYSPQNIVASGRWFLQYACGISSYFDLPWLNSLLSAFYLGLTAAAVTELFDLKNPFVIALSGAILVASPCTTETFFFSYTADGYMLGLLLSALAAVLSVKSRNWKSSVLSAALLCLSMGIYQAYVSFAILLCAAYLVLELLEDRMSMKEAWGWIGRHAVIYGGALAAYYVIWKAALHISGLSAVSYQGIDQVGHISLSTIVNAVRSSVLNLYTFFVERDLFEYTPSAYTVFNIIWVVCFVAVCIYAVVKTKTWRRVPALLTILLAAGMCIPLISIWEFTSDQVYYRPMMLHSICVLYILSLILFDRYVKASVSTVVGLFMAVMVFNNAIIANISYFYMDRCYEKTYYVATQMMTEIEEICTQEDVAEIAFIGEREDVTHLAMTHPADRAIMMTANLEEDLLFDAEHSYLVMSKLLGLDVPASSMEKREALAEDTAVQEMPAWPDRDCMEMMGDTLVVKLG